MARTIRSFPGRWNKSPDFTKPGCKLSYHERAVHGLVPHEISTTFRGGRLDNYSLFSGNRLQARRWYKRHAGKQRRAFNSGSAREGLWNHLEDVACRDGWWDEPWRWQR